MWLAGCKDNLDWYEITLLLFSGFQNDIFPCGCKLSLKAMNTHPMEQCKVLAMYICVSMDATSSALWVLNLLCPWVFLINLVFQIIIPLQLAFPLRNSHVFRKNLCLCGWQPFFLTDFLGQWELSLCKRSMIPAGTAVVGSWGTEESQLNENTYHSFLQNWDLL